MLKSWSLKFIMLVNVKMPTIVGTKTCISMINATSESLKARKVFIFQHFRFYEQFRFHAQLSLALKISSLKILGSDCHGW